jgi:hypothetical protein
MDISLRVCTIRHTGTHFLFHVLANLGYNEAVIDFKKMRLRHKDAEHYYLHTHIEMGKQIIMNTPCQYVTTLRNPIEVFRTHVYRYHWDSEAYVPYILNAFEQRAKFIKEHNAYVFWVDSPYQHLEVARLAKWLNIQNWAFKKLPTNIHTNRRMPCDKELFINPPKEIRLLAEESGY